MKNKTFYTSLAYWFLVLGLLLLSGCKTKKSTTDFKETKTENVSVIDNSTIDKKETVKENNTEKKTTAITDKSFFEAWMSFESDKITITDNQGNKTEIINPRFIKKQSQRNDMTKNEQTDTRSNKIASNEENKKNDLNIDFDKETKITLLEKILNKTKEPVWLWIVGGSIVGGLAYGILKKFK